MYPKVLLLFSVYPKQEYKSTFVRDMFSLSHQCVGTGGNSIKDVNMKGKHNMGDGDVPRFRRETSRVDMDRGFLLRYRNRRDKDRKGSS